MKKPIFLLVAMSVLLTACAMQEGDFPSLAKRPYEDVAVDPEPFAPPPAITSLPGPMQALVDRAVQQSSAAHAKFLRNLPAVKNRVIAARGAAVSSEAWVVAQMDLSSLEFDRGASVEALADIDRAYIERLSSEYEDESPGGAAIIASRREQIAAQVKSQQDEIDALRYLLR